MFESGAVKPWLDGTFASRTAGEGVHDTLQAYNLHERIAAITIEICVGFAYAFRRID